VGRHFFESWTLFGAWRPFLIDIGRLTAGKMAVLGKMERPALEDPDIHLMLSFKNGDKSAFEALLRKHYRNVLNFSYRFLGRRDLAEDLTHEVFLRVYQNPAGYEPRSRFRTWLYTIAKNLCLNELRRKSHRMQSLDEPGLQESGQMSNAIPDPSLPPEESLVRKERIAAVRAAIDELPENQRLAVILRRYDDFSYEQIAATLNTSEKAVKSLLNRAKEHLQKKLAPWVEKKPL
jgi:RNA polymerase sigma-70 factor (ECF subfamily)